MKAAAAAAQRGEERRGGRGVEELTEKEYNGKYSLADANARWPVIASHVHATCRYVLIYFIEKANRGASGATISPRPLAYLLRTPTLSLPTPSNRSVASRAVLLRVSFRAVVAAALPDVISPCTVSLVWLLIRSSRPRRNVNAARCSIVVDFGPRAHDAHTRVHTRRRRRRTKRRRRVSTRAHMLS